MPGLPGADLLAIGLLLAVIASTALNAGYLLQHLGGSTVPAIGPRRPLESLRSLGSSRLWLIGTATRVGVAVILMAPGGAGTGRRAALRTLRRRGGAPEPSAQPRMRAAAVH